MRFKTVCLLITAFVWLLVIIGFFCIPALTVHGQCAPRADWTNTYTVARGDNLYRISRRFGIAVTEIAQGNCLPNANFIYVGQVLRVPGASTGQPLPLRLWSSTDLFELSYGAGRILLTLQPGVVTAQGRTADTNWIFVQTANARGWVVSYALEIDGGLVVELPVVNTQGSVDSSPDNPTCAALPSRLSVGMQARVLPGTPNNVRTIPSTSGAIAGVLPGGRLFSVTGGPRCAQGVLWWQIAANGIVGWTGELQGATYWVEPANGTSSGTTATVTTSVLNVRNAPSTWANILTRIHAGSTYNVVGRLANNSWLQLNVNSTLGWVNARYVSATGLGGVPIIVP